MARAFTGAMLAEIQKQTVSPIILYEGEFDGGTIHLWSGIGTIAWNGNTYTGAGQVLSVSAIEETVEVRAAAVQVGLSGLPSAIVSLALSSARQGKKGRLWLGFMDASNAIIADPYLIFTGLLDVPTMDETGDTATVTVSYENRLVGLLVANDRRYTPEDQHVEFPGDTGFDFVAGLQDATIIW